MRKKKSIKFHTETTTTKSEKREALEHMANFIFPRLGISPPPFLSPQLPLWLGYEPSSLSPTPLNTQTAAYDRGNESELQLRHGARTRHRIQFSRSFLTFEPSINNSTKDEEKTLLHCNQEVVVLSLCCWVSVGKHQRSERTHFE